MGYHCFTDCDFGHRGVATVGGQQWQPGNGSDMNRFAGHGTEDQVTGVGLMMTVRVKCDEAVGEGWRVVTHRKSRGMKRETRSVAHSLARI